ncbi:MAG TPA: hypothetical protein VIY69_11390 [Candidatus Acidoferrales bacterium]
MQLSHLALMTLFALLVAIAFAALGRRTFASRIRYAAWCFAILMVLAIGIGWLLFPLSR